MTSIVDFFGKDEWKVMFLASILLLFITIFFLLSRLVLWIAFGIFLISVLFTGYKLFFGKNALKFSAEDMGDFFKRK